MAADSLEAAVFNWSAAIVFKHAPPDYSVRGTDLFSPRLPNRKMTAASTTLAIWCECPVLNHNTGHMTELQLTG